MLDTIAANRVTTICAPPTVWRMFVQEDLKAWQVSLREVCSAGEPLNPEVIEQVQAAWGLTVRDFYGQTETTSQVGNPPGIVVRPGSMGLPLPGYRIRILDGDDREAGEGEVCIELEPRPTGLMLDYQQKDASYAPLGATVYRTGDVAMYDADGHLNSSARPTTCSRRPTTASAHSSWRAR